MARDKRMKRVLIGIDSADNLRYSMIVGGPEEHFNVLYERVAKVFMDAGVKKMHFSKTDRKILEKISRPIATLITASKNISFRVIEHKKPDSEPHKRYFLSHVPRGISEHLKSFDNRNRLLHIEIHDDYRVRGVKNSTYQFSDRLIRFLSREMSREGVGIKILKNGKFGLESSKMITKNENYIKIKTRCVRQQDSAAVNLADISLGLFRKYNRLVNKKVKYRKI